MYQFGAKFYFDTAMETRLGKKIDDQGTKFDKKLADQEARLKEHMRAEFNQLRLEIRNDRLQDQLNFNGKDKDEGKKV
jgi:hypothetical protein